MRREASVRRASKKAISILLYVVFLILAAEVGLRVVSHFVYKTPLLDIRRLRSDPYVFWKFNPGYEGKLYTFKYARINHHGFLGKELEVPKGADLIRIVAIGGSVSLGYGVGQMSDCYCSLLDSLLNLEAGPRRYEVVNAAGVGYSSYMGRRFVEHYLQSLQPDVLVAAFGWNDSILSRAADKDPVYWKKNRLAFTPEFWQENSILFLVVPRIINDARRRFWGRGVRRADAAHENHPYIPRISPQDFMLNLEAIHQWCAAHGVKMVLLTEAAANDSRSGAGAIQNLQPYHTAIRQMAFSQGVPLADVDSCLEGEGTASYYDNAEADYVHMNRSGQLRMAQIVKQTLQSSGYLSR
jgi:lysophospholipase L1-like esterase